MIETVFPVDFIVTWVDGSDPKWIKEKNKYLSKDSRIDASDERYRENGLLKYWFRMIEKNAPWVNKIHFVTFGHVPSWLNTNHPKIHVVKHVDFIAKENLPTFNSCAIEANLHKIPNLSEHFVYFNDDMYINRPITPEIFFTKNGTPKATYAIKKLGKTKTHASKICVNCNRIVKKYKNNHNEFNLRNGFLMTIANIKTAILNREGVGYSSKHIPTPYTKSTFSNLWKNERAILLDTSSSRFRKDENVSQWLFEFYQMATNKACPRSYKVGKYYYISNTPESILTELIKHKHSLICINDCDKEDKSFLKQLSICFEKTYAEISSYELLKELR